MKLTIDVVADIALTRVDEKNTYIIAMTEKGYKWCMETFGKRVYTGTGKVWLFKPEMAEELWSVAISDGLCAEKD